MTRNEHHTSLYLPADVQAALRAVATDLGLMNERGPGAGQLGSVSALVAAIGRAAIERPAETRAAIGILLRK